MVCPKCKGSNTTAYSCGASSKIRCWTCQPHVKGR